MVARAHDRVLEMNDPTAHAVVMALREAARKLGTVRLADATIFATEEPCPMCVGALMASDVEALVYAVANDRDGAAGTVIQLAQHPGLPRRIRIVSGIRRDQVGGARRARAPRADRGRTARPTSFGILSGGEVSEWLMVPLSKSGVRKHRGFESRPLRHSAPVGRPCGVGACAPRLRTSSALAPVLGAPSP